MSGGCEPSKRCIAFWIGAGAGMGAIWAAVIGAAFQGNDDKAATTISYGTAIGLAAVSVTAFCASRASSCCKRSSEPTFSDSASPSSL